MRVIILILLIFSWPFITTAQKEGTIQGSNNNEGWANYKSGRNLMDDISFNEIEIANFDSHTVHFFVGLLPLDIKYGSLGFIGEMRVAKIIGIKIPVRIGLFNPNPPKTGVSTYSYLGSNLSMDIPGVNIFGSGLDLGIYPMKYRIFQFKVGLGFSLNSAYHLRPNYNQNSSNFQIDSYTKTTFSKIMYYFSGGLGFWIHRFKIEVDFNIGIGNDKEINKHKNYSQRFTLTPSLVYLIQ